MAALAGGMVADMREQPVAVARALEQAALVGAELERPRGAMLFGRGTSEHAAAYGRYLLECVAGLPVAIGAPSVATLYRAPVALDGWLAVGISQSGETEEIKGCLAWAREHGARTLAITNVDPSPLARAADVTLALEAGPERAVAATKTFTAQCAALARLAHSWTERSLPTDRLIEAVEDALACPITDELVEALSQAEFSLVLGRGAYTPMASELALKLMEGCRIWSWGGSWADLLHGPITALPEGTPALAFSGSEELAGSWASARSRIESRGFKLWPINPGHRSLGALAAIADIVIGQRIVLSSADRRGTDPDHPPGLQKVTQT